MMFQEKSGDLFLLLSVNSSHAPLWLSAVVTLSIISFGAHVYSEENPKVSSLPHSQRFILASEWCLLLGTRSFLQTW